MLHVHHFLFNPLEENTYLVYNEKGDCVIIDPGCYTAEEQNTLASFIADNRLTPQWLLNTHCHLDHVFGNEFIRQRYGLELRAHRLEQQLLAFAPEMGRMWGLNVVPYTGAFMELSGGDTLLIGEDRLKVLFTPGHSPGSCSFYAPEEKWVIGGDVLFRESIGRTDLPGGDLNTLLQSIRSQLFTLPDEVVVYSGHGPSTTIGHEKTRNPFLSGNS